ncbi:MAG: hypothetical protein IJP36_02125 [Bacteroides sp.]|nr:hypothetical protein [Bacteroides sp.]
MTQSVILNDRISRELHFIQDDRGQVLAEALDGVMSLLLEHRDNLSSCNNLLDHLEALHLARTSLLKLVPTEHEKGGAE